MKKLNKTGKIKAIILGISALPNLLIPIGATGPQGLVIILFPFIFGCIAVPFISKLNKKVLGREIIKPNWNDNPLKRTLSLFHFGAFFFLTIGLSIVSWNRNKISNSKLFWSNFNFMRAWNFNRYLVDTKSCKIKLI